VASLPVTAPVALRTHIVLVGLPGAGKTTVGAALARVLDCPFVDLDEDVVRYAGQPIAAIFASHGERHFRTLEREATLRVQRTRPSIVAPGGGWVTVPETVALLRPPARLTYLKVDPATAARRLHRSAHLRPLLRSGPEAALEQLLESRRKAYEGSDWVIDTQVLSRQQVIDKLVALVTDESSP
jgi:shikimate kinase